MSKEKEEFVNPIDPDKIAENPHALPYAHTVGGVPIKPIDRGRAKGLSLSSMYDQTDMQLDQIREQIELLARQARGIQARVRVSELIYEAETAFKPVVGHEYHLYRRKNKSLTLSMVSPDEWGGTAPFSFVASVRLLADHTWEITDGTADTILSENDTP